MSDYNPLSNGTTFSGRSVNDDPFFDRYPILDIDSAVVPAQDGAMTNVAMVSYPHISYEQSGFANICIVSDNGFFSIKFVEHLRPLFFYLILYNAGRVAMSTIGYI
jgi:hypothetical protein